MRRIQLYLSLIGCVCALTGAFLLLAASFPMLAQLQWDEPLPEHAVYVGSDACFTCHLDEQGGWSNPVNPRLIDDRVVNSQAVAMNLSAAAALPIGSSFDHLSVRSFDASLRLPFLTTYHFANPYPSTLTLRAGAEEQQP
jgi:hypothetical protein